MIVNDWNDQKEFLRSIITGWTGHGWKDGKYVDDLEEYFTDVLSKIEADEAEKADEAEGTEHENYIFYG